MDFAGQITECPHCAMTVQFSRQGTCPSCGIRGDAPVSDADRARIGRVREASVQATVLERPELLQGVSARGGYMLGRMLALLAFAVLFALFLLIDQTGQLLRAIFEPSG